MSTVNNQRIKREPKNIIRIKKRTTTIMMAERNVSASLGDDAMGVGLTVFYNILGYIIYFKNC